MPSLTFFNDEDGDLVAAPQPEVSGLELVSLRISKLQGSLRASRARDARLARAAKPPEPKKGKACSNCKKAGHYRTTCPDLELPRRAPEPASQVQSKALKDVGSWSQRRLTKSCAECGSRGHLTPDCGSLQAERGRSGRLCSWCSDLPHRRALTGCPGCELPYVPDVVTLDPDGMRSSAGLLVEE